MKTYSDKLRDPRWQRKRLEVMERDGFKCTQCGDKKSTLNIHHWKYTKNPWDAPNTDLSTVCESCHKEVEESKSLMNSFIKYSDFRILLININRILQKGEIKIKYDDNEILIHKRDVLSEFDNLIESSPDNLEDYYLKYHLFSKASPSTWKGHMFIQHGDDPRVIPFTDSLKPDIQINLQAIAYHKGSVSLLWTTHIPSGYEEGCCISEPEGDSWYVCSSKISEI